MFWNHECILQVLVDSRGAAHAESDATPRADRFIPRGASTPELSGRANKNSKVESRIGKRMNNDLCQR